MGAFFYSFFCIMNCMACKKTLTTVIFKSESLLGKHSHVFSKCNGIKYTVINVIPPLQGFFFDFKFVYILSLLTFFHMQTYTGCWLDNYTFTISKP